MNKKIVTGLFSCLLITITFARGMGSAVPEFHVDPTEEKLLVVEVERDAVSWDQISTMVRPEFKAMLEQECGEQELTAACKTLQSATSPSAYQAFISYVQQNGVVTATRPYCSIDHNFEQALNAQLVVAHFHRSNYLSARERVTNYEKSRRHVWIERLAVFQAGVCASLLIFAIVYGLQNKITCLI